MKYAVIKTGGKQYLVSEGDVLEVEKLPKNQNGEITFEKILLYVDWEDNHVFKLGNPYLQGFLIKGKLLEEKKNQKVTVAKFKSKVRYRRKIGFRKLISKILIEKIGNDKVLTGEKKEAQKGTRRK